MPLETENLDRAVDVLKTLGKVYLSQNQYREATEKFENILRLGVKDADVYRHLAIALAGQKLYTPDALRVFRWAVEKFPHDRSLCLHVAQAALHHHAEDDNALHFYIAALKFHPPFAKDLYLHLHAIFHRQKKYDESFQTLKQALYLEKSGEAELVTRLTQLGWRYDREQELIMTLQFLLGNNEANRTIRHCLAFSLAYRIIRYHGQPNSNEVNGPFSSETDLPVLLAMLPNPANLKTLETVRDYCTLQLALLAVTTAKQKLSPKSPAGPREMVAPKAFEYHSLLDALPLEDVLAEATSSPNQLPTLQTTAKPENHTTFDWHRDFLKFLPVVSENDDMAGSAQTNAPFDMAALLILAPTFQHRQAEPNQTSVEISTQQAIALVIRHLNAAEISRRIYTLSDGIIIFSSSLQEQAQVSLTLLKKIAHYNIQVPAKDQIALQAALHALPPEQRFVLSRENNASTNFAGLKLVCEGLHLLRVERDEPEPANKNHWENRTNTTTASRLLMCRRVFESLNDAGLFTVKYCGPTYWGAPGWHEEVCELAWYNPLDYASEKTPYALERFLVIEKIKAQPTYDTYRTRDRTLERPVILKALRPEIYLRQRRDESQRVEMVKAIRRLGRLEHPGMAMIYDMGTHEDIFYLVREHIEGENLAQSFTKQQRLSPVEAARLLLEICRILRYAHQNGVCHGNLKPSNIWRVKSAAVSEPIRARALLAPPPSQSEKITIMLKISDFFIPSFSEISPADWYYAPPELKLQNTHARFSKLHATVDIYALGMLLYDCIGGENPFKAMPFLAEKSIWEEAQLTPFSILTNQITGILPALDEVIQRATHREPYQRYQTIDEFETALRQVLKEPSAFIEKQRRLISKT